MIEDFKEDLKEMKLYRMVEIINPMGRPIRKPIFIKTIRADLWLRSSNTVFGQKGIESTHKGICEIGEIKKDDVLEYNGAFYKIVYVNYNLTKMFNDDSYVLYADYDSNFKIGVK